jgi:hypothetical protein
MSNREPFESVIRRQLIIIIFLASVNLGWAIGASGALDDMLFDQPEIGSAVSIDRIECSEGTTP